jgi:P-type Cu+ transporter
MIDTKTYQPDISSDTCYHCGDKCANSGIYINDKLFCCHGCKTVYEILNANDLCDYYSIDDNPGITIKDSPIKNKFAYLDDEDVKNKIIDFRDKGIIKVSFYIPSMHCSSCVWLLENLYKLSQGVLESRVDFLKKELTLKFDENKTSLRKMVELLNSIGYEPQINLKSIDARSRTQSNKDLYLKIGVAGFCFANIMLFSFPDYLSLGKGVEEEFKRFFGIMNIVIALPVLFYSSADYFRSALHGWKQQMINMDVPIAIGILTLFFRSLFDILSGTGAGYMDSFTGLVFLLLAGKIFEKRTYETLSFDRDYKSYFPISITKKHKNTEKTISIEKLKPGDRIVIRNGELIPADAIMINGEAYIDYSFVTGESTPEKKESGEMIYAGGRQIGGIIELDIIKEVSQSYLTRLWNDDAFSRDYKSKITSLANTISRYFTIAVISIAVLSTVYWLIHDSSLAWNALTSVLIIACPCALALSTPFTLGNTMRIFGRNHFYLKNTSVIESLAKIDVIVFDKTGTITHSKRTGITFMSSDQTRPDLGEDEKSLILSLARQSAHPLSRQIAAAHSDYRFYPVENFEEISGKGISGKVKNRMVCLGSAEFLGRHGESDGQVYVEIDGNFRGTFLINTNFRPGLRQITKQLQERFRLYLLTGDNERERPYLLKYFPQRALNFNQDPYNKLEFVKRLQNRDKRVLMIGDGLNDAGALKQSDAGVSVTDDINMFSPASDAILDGSTFNRLGDFLMFARQSMRIIVISFIISFIYNFVGLSFAVTGTLSPLIAAVLMPVSSISVILFTTGSTFMLAKKYRMV